MSKREIAFRATGKKFVFRGVDDPGKLKSMVGFQRIILEEADQFTVKDFLEITRRARGIKGIQIVLVFNPVNIEHWIKNLLFDTPSYRAKTDIIHATYRDNKFLTEDDIMALEMLKDISQYDYDVYVLGKWGVIRPDDPFFYNFDDRKHVRECSINKFLPIYLSFDFNIVNSCIAGQVSVSERYVRVLKEWHKKGLDLEDLVIDIVNEYGVNRQYVITGDASGNSGSALTKGNIGAYEIIKKTLKEIGVENAEFRVPNSNLGLLNSKTICNTILKKEEDLFLDNNCTQTKNDIMRMKQSSDGGLDKKDANAKDYGHLGDCFRYFLANFCMDLFKSYKIYAKN
jgi:phage terminase large subunit